jgi:hypothetical protein
MIRSPNLDLFFNLFTIQRLFHSPFGEPDEFFVTRKPQRDDLFNRQLPVQRPAGKYEISQVLFCPDGPILYLQRERRTKTKMLIRIKATSTSREAEYRLSLDA